MRLKLICSYTLRLVSRRVRFSDDADDDDNATTHKHLRCLEEIDMGEFCRIISAETKSRVCLVIKDGKLQRSLESEPPNEVVEGEVGISLREILESYRLTDKMKFALAYILAFSMWQYYISDWMRAPWTVDTIQFMKYHARGEAPQLFAARPYLSVLFGEPASGVGDSSTAPGIIHRYPHVRTLGIMLVEIGMGAPLSQSGEKMSNTARANTDWTLAKRNLGQPDLWSKFDYPKYQTIAGSCLDPRLFDNAPFTPCADGHISRSRLEKRRQILYDNVVAPLEKFLKDTGWKEQLNSIGPLQAPPSHPPDSPPSRANAHKDKATDYEKPQRKPSKEKQNASQQWLEKIDFLNQKLISTTARCQKRVTIAILDTGYDDGAAFFQSPRRRVRLQKWRDWVVGAQEPKDADGHGTYILSLIMRIAPEANLCVARVARKPSDLDVVDNVVQVSCPDQL